MPCRGDAHLVARGVSVFFAGYAAQTACGAMLTCCMPFSRETPQCSCCILFSLKQSVSVALWCEAAASSSCCPLHLVPWISYGLRLSGGCLTSTHVTYGAAAVTWRAGKGHVGSPTQLAVVLLSDLRCRMMLKHRQQHLCTKAAASLAAMPNGSSRWGYCSRSQMQC